MTKAIVFAVVTVMAGCAHQPVRVTDTLIVPPDLIRPVCDRWHYVAPTPNDAHWDGSAVLVWDTNSEVIGIDCLLTSLMTGGMETLTVRYDIGVPQARDLRQFLAANQIEIASSLASLIPDDR